QVAVCDVLYVVFLFFFQAEDGIRDRNVTGVQTCALPIWVPPGDLGEVDPVDHHDSDPVQSGDDRQDQWIGVWCDEADDGVEHEHAAAEQRGVLDERGGQFAVDVPRDQREPPDRKSTRLNSSHV